MSGGSGSSGSSNGLGGMPAGGYAGASPGYGVAGDFGGYTGGEMSSSYGGEGRSTYGTMVDNYKAKDKNTSKTILGSILSAIGFMVPGGSIGVLVGGKMIRDAGKAAPAIDKAMSEFESTHPEMVSYMEEARTIANNAAIESFSMGTSTGNGEGKAPAEQQTSSAKTAAAAAKAASDKAAADKAKVAQAATDKAAKAVADKAKADEEAKTKATLLAKRRQSSRRYYTSGGAQGLLGQAPVRLKTLLGE